MHISVPLRHNAWLTYISVGLRVPNAYHLPLSSGITLSLYTQKNCAIVSNGVTEEISQKLKNKERVLQITASIAVIDLRRHHANFPLATAVLLAFPKNYF